MLFNNHQTIFLIICLFSIVELIVSFFIHYFSPCESQRDVLYFIETSGIIGFLSALFYFILKELNKNHENMYLIFSNIYFVSIICAGLYWLIALAIESRRFFDNFYYQPCQTAAFYFLAITLCGNYLVFLLLIIYALCFYYSDMNNKRDLYSQATLIR